MRNLGSSELIELAVKTENATLTETGALRVITGKYTGRAPNGKRIVFDRVTKDCVDWNNNVSISLECFRDLLEKFKFYHQNRAIYSQDVYAVETQSIPWLLEFIQSMQNTACLLETCSFRTKKQMAHLSQIGKYFIFLIFLMNHRF